MDDRDLSFSKSDDEQSEMSNHDYEQDIKPVRMRTRVCNRVLTDCLYHDSHNKCVATLVCDNHYR